jgi:hypothetical protein
LIYYNNSSHSGVPPPDQEETENDREGDEDVEDERATKKSTEKCYFRFFKILEIPPVSHTVSPIFSKKLEISRRYQDDISNKIDIGDTI